MGSILIPFLIGLSASLRGRVEMQAEIAALHQQLRILQRRSRARPRLGSTDRIFWTWLSRPSRGRAISLCRRGTEGERRGRFRGFGGL